MFAVKPRMSFTLRVLLIAMILFNALAPTGALAKSSLEPDNSAQGHQNERNKKESNFLPSAEINYKRFARPNSRSSESPQADESSLAQTPAVLLQCVSDYCSDTTPNVILSESFDSYWTTELHFRILCTGMNCSKKDVYYSISVTTLYEDPWGPGSPISWKANVYARAHAGETGTGGDGTGARYDILCGIAPAWVINECSFATSGVISAEKISGNASAGSHFFVHTDSNSAGTGSWTRRQVKIHVSLTPFGEKIPDDSANCKGCPYGGSQAWVADPINSNTGAFSYPVKDLEVATSAGPLTFRRTYVSSLANKFTTPLGNGWVHNQDLRLILPIPNEPSLVRFKDPSGNLYQFWYAKDASTGVERFTPYSGYTASLSKNSGTPVTYTLRDQAQNVYTFDESGKITSLVNASEQTLTYEYVNGQLFQVRYDATHYLEFQYYQDNPNRLEFVKDQTGRSVKFYYDSNGDLDKFDDVLGLYWTQESGQFFSVC